MVPKVEVSQAKASTKKSLKHGGTTYKSKKSFGRETVKLSESVSNIYLTSRCSDKMARQLITSEYLKHVKFIIKVR